MHSGLKIAKYFAPTIASCLRYILETVLARNTYPCQQLAYGGVEFSYEQYSSYLNFGNVFG